MTTTNNCNRQSSSASRSRGAAWSIATSRHRTRAIKPTNNKHNKCTVGQPTRSQCRIDRRARVSSSPPRWQTTRPRRSARADPSHWSSITKTTNSIVTRCSARISSTLAPRASFSSPHPMPTPATGERLPRSRIRTTTLT